MTAKVNIANLTFLQPNELDGLKKALSRSSKSAVRFLQGIMEDESNDPKTRMDAAKFLVQQHVAVSTEISKDTLQRTILEIKSQGGLTPSKQVGYNKDIEDEKPKALYDPSAVIKIGEDIVEEDGTIDLGNVDSIK